MKIIFYTYCLKMLFFMLSFQLTQAQYNIFEESKWKIDNPLAKPILTLSVTEINFGDVHTIKDTVFVISNTGNTMLKVSSMEAVGYGSFEYSFPEVQAPFQIPAGKSREIPIRFIATLNGHISRAKVVFKSNSDANPSIDVVGVGYNPKDCYSFSIIPNFVDLGNIIIKETYPIDIIIVPNYFPFYDFHFYYYESIQISIRNIKGYDGKISYNLDFTAYKIGKQVFYLYFYNENASLEILTIIANVLPPPNTEIELPQIVDFGKCEKSNNSIEKKIYIKNKGQNKLYINKISIKDDEKIFAYSLENNVIEQADSTALVVSFYPSSYGTKKARIILETNTNSSPQEIFLQGEVIKIPRIKLEPNIVNVNLPIFDSAEYKVRIKNISDTVAHISDVYCQDTLIRIKYPIEPIDLEPDQEDSIVFKIISINKEKSFQRIILNGNFLGDDYVSINKQIFYDTLYRNSISLNINYLSFGSIISRINYDTSIILKNITNKKILLSDLSAESTKGRVISITNYSELIDKLLEPNEAIEIKLQYYAIQLGEFRGTIDIIANENYVVGEIIYLGVATTISDVFDNGKDSSYELKVFPNPCTELVRFDYSTGFSLFEIYDIYGNTIKKYNIEGIEQSSYIIWDTKDNFGNSIPSGNYFVKCFREDKVIMKKIAIIR